MTPDPIPVVVARVNQLGVPGFVVYIEPSGKADLERALVRRGRGRSPTRPRSKRRASKPDIRCSAIDMTDDTIPLEAGIEERAISFTQGMLRRPGSHHPRAASRARPRRAGSWWRFVVERKRPASGREDSRGRSRRRRRDAALPFHPRFGSIALGYVHRDFTAPGTRVERSRAGGGRVDGDGQRPADFRQQSRSARRRRAESRACASSSRGTHRIS